LPVVGLELQRRVVLPRYAQPDRHPHYATGAERAALLAGSDIFLRIPRVGSLLSGIVEWYARRITVRRRDHAKAPVFGDDGGPDAGEVGGRDASRCGWLCGLLRTNRCSRSQRDHRQTGHRRS
jgi:hypothetical protein